MAPQVWNLRSERGFACVARALAREQSRGELRVVHYSVQGNHLHMIVETADRGTLARRMQGFGVRLARAVNTMMRRRRGRVLGDRYHARVLATPREVHRAVRYVLQNHAKHAASWSPRDAIPRTPAVPHADRFSSAVTRSFVVTPRAGPRASFALVSSASSWLLRRGLQRGAPRVVARGSS